MRKKHHKVLSPLEKAKMKAAFGQALRSTLPMWHSVQLEAIVNSHEFGPSPMTGGNPGPILTQKVVKFVGTGHTLDVAIGEAHSQLTAFLQSDGITIGSEKDTPSSPTSPILQPFAPGKQ